MNRWLASITILSIAILSATSLAQQAAAPPREVRNGALSAEDLAEFLGVGAWVFEYDGGRPRCFLEVEEEGQKTVSKKEVLTVEETNRGPDGRRGKVLLFLRRADVQLRIHSEASRGGAGMALPPDALWWGWKAFSGSTTRLEKPITPKTGEPVVLLRHEMTEAGDGVADPKHPRKVVLTLKLAVEAE
jgi:hypothetical protein